MKKISLEYRLRQKILREKLEKQLRKKRQKKLRSKQSPERKSDDTNSPEKENPSSNSIIINRDIDLYEEDNRKALSKTCQDIRSFQGNHLHLFFESNEVKMSAAGMLLLYAEIYRKIEIEGTKITCNYPANRKAEQVFQHIGFFEKIGKKERISNNEIQRADKDVRSWHAITGDMFSGKKVCEFLDKVAPSMDQEDNVYIAVKEIIGNAEDHAYEEDASFRPWIAFARINEDGEIVIVVGDLGKTIPHTIKEKTWFKEWESRRVIDFSSRTVPKKIWSGDSKLIYIATKPKETTTLESYRGLGLRDAIKNIQDLHGKVLIYSRAGFYYSQLSRKERKERQSNLAGIIQGTIVQIIIPLPSEE